MITKKDSNGTSFIGLLAILFIGLRLTENITWEWWWVLSPLWLTFLLGMIIASIKKQ